MKAKALNAEQLLSRDTEACVTSDEGIFESMEKIVLSCLRDNVNPRQWPKNFLAS